MNLDEDEDEDALSVALSDALSESSDSSSEDEEAPQMNQMSENEDQQDDRYPADITHPNTEYEEDIELIQEHRASRKRKNKSNENEPKQKKTLPVLTNNCISNFDNFFIVPGPSGQGFTVEHF
jgi:hypothetical protein